MNKNSTLQSQIELKPNNWFSNQTESSIQEMMCKFLEKCSVNFRKYRYYYLLQKLEKVVNEDNKVDERIKYFNKSLLAYVQTIAAIKNLLPAKGNAIYVGPKLLLSMLTV